MMIGSSINTGASQPPPVSLPHHSNPMNPNHASIANLTNSINNTIGLCQQQISSNLQSQLSSNLINSSVNLQQFDNIRKWLSKNHKKYFENDQPPSNKTLSQFLCQFVQFQEDLLGKSAASTHKLSTNVTRLPVFIF